jgi:hypothetical protein
MKNPIKVGPAALFILFPVLASAQTPPSINFDQGTPSSANILEGLAVESMLMPEAPGACIVADAAPSQPATAAVPALPLGTHKEFIKPFHDAFVKAVQRLRSPECSKFYGEGAEALFQSAEYRFLPLGAPAINEDGRVGVVGACTHADTRPPSVFINLQGPFLSQLMYVPGKNGLQTLDFNSNLRGADFGALLLLHELGHMVGKFGPDANDYQLNLSYTQEVLKNCFKDCY